MSTDKNQNDAPDENEGGEESEDEVVTLKKSEYATLNETIGSLKRELKALKKKSDDTPEKTIPDKKSDDFGYGELSYLIAKGIKDEDTSFVKDEFKKFRVGNADGKLEDLLGNEYFKSRLDARISERETRDAIPQGQGRGSQGGNDSIEIAFQKYRATGKLPQGKENAGLRAKLATMRLEAEKSLDEGPDQPIVGHYIPQ